MRAFRSVGGTPPFIQKGKGAHIIDADGNEFIDYCGSWGPLILGHANKKVVDAIKTTVENGSSFGAPTALENDLAELILSNNKYIEKCLNELVANLPVANLPSGKSATGKLGTANLPRKPLCRQNKNSLPGKLTLKLKRQI